ncbi:oxidoreductase-like domain-containing protein [Fodinibius sp. AD559]|uniref:oxidoreductase-like domain-containing protein n=1 Tax=Fodinibius sp. AD559 TaxID=3424179 RepID=UPI004046E539
MRKPIRPLPTDCCGSGCTKCIYEIYEEHLEKYNEWKKQQKEYQNNKPERQ